MLVEAILRRMWRKSHSLILNITEDRSLSYMIILSPKKKYEQERLYHINNDILMSSLLSWQHMRIISPFFFSLYASAKIICMQKPDDFQGVSHLISAVVNETHDKYTSRTREEVWFQKCEWVGNCHVYWLKI